MTWFTLMPMRRAAPVLLDCPHGKPETGVINDQGHNEEKQTRGQEDDDRGGGDGDAKDIKLPEIVEIREWLALSIEENLQQILDDIRQADGCDQAGDRSCVFGTQRFQGNPIDENARTAAKKDACRNTKHRMNAEADQHHRDVRAQRVYGSV